MIPEVQHFMSLKGEKNPRSMSWKKSLRVNKGVGLFPWKWGFAAVSHLTTWIKKEKKKKKKRHFSVLSTYWHMPPALFGKEKITISFLSITDTFFLVFSFFLYWSSLCKWKGFVSGLILRQKSMCFTTRQSTSKNQFSVMSRQAHKQGTRAQVLGITALDQGSLY